MLSLIKRVQSKVSLVKAKFPLLFYILLVVICFIDIFNTGSGYWVPPYIKHLIFLVGVYMLLAMSLNLVMGLAGQLSFGHAAFYGIGAYASAMLTKNVGMPFIMGLVAAGLTAAIIAIPLIYSSVKLKGNYLGIVTLGFGEIVRIVLINLSITGGASGLPGIKAPALFGIKFTAIGPTGKEAYIILLYLLVGLVYLFIQRLMRSRVGRALVSLREDELAASCMGVDTKLFKAIAFITSACIAGFAGCIYAHYATFISPDNFGMSETRLIICMVVLGGMGSTTGAMLGAAILTLLPEALRVVKDIFDLSFDPRLIFYGLLLISLMYFRPKGLLGGRLTVFHDSRLASALKGDRAYEHS